ncbi:fumarylacetoacetase [Adhaeribacter terreus]|uniref:fumarylacetoacetase n=1 Tax=Adhaeribacter terreus TaxID=529703 RepID=A0ABW0E5X5_9BACT
MIKANDPNLHSWITIAPDCEFPIQNLPFGIFKAGFKDPRVGVAIGEYVLDLYALSQFGYFEEVNIPDHTVLFRDTLNAFIALGKPVWRQTRERVSELLRNDNGEFRDNEEAVRECLIKRSEVEMLMPVRVPNYTDFYSSIEHATNVGMMFRDPANALLPNWKHLPVGYHGRASSITVSGTDVIRPNGQTKVGDNAPTFGPTKELDFELEVAFITGRETQLGSTVTPDEAEDYIFGMVLFNDWSARDMQRWEYVPLGPFLAKNFASTISPWVVTLDALEPFRVAGPEQEPAVLPYLQYSGNKNLDINLEVLLKPEGGQETTICRSNYKYMYWNMNQQLAHQTSNGCNLQIGDMYASGTISGKDETSYGSMLELTWKGTKPLQLPDGSERKFINDGDTVTMRGYAEKNGIRIGFGDCTAKVLPAL